MAALAAGHAVGGVEHVSEAVQEAVVERRMDGGDERKIVVGGDRSGYRCQRADTADLSGLDKRVVVLTCTPRLAR